MKQNCRRPPIDRGILQYCLPLYHNDYSFTILTEAQRSQLSGDNEKLVSISTTSRQRRVPPPLNIAADPQH